MLRRLLVRIRERDQSAFTPRIAQELQSCRQRPVIEYLTIAMKPQPEPSTQEVLAGLIERVMQRSDLRVEHGHVAVKFFD